MTSYQRRFLRIRVTHSRSCYHRLVGTKRVTQGLGPEKIIKYALLKSEVRTPLPTLLYRLHSDGTSPHHAFLPPSLSLASVPTPLRRPPPTGRWSPLLLRRLPPPLTSLPPPPPVLFPRRHLSLSPTDLDGASASLLHRQGLLQALQAVVAPGGAGRVPYGSGACGPSSYRWWCATSSVPAPYSDSAWAPVHRRRWEPSHSSPLPRSTFCSSRVSQTTDAEYFLRAILCLQRTLSRCSTQCQQDHLTWGFANFSKTNICLYCNLYARLYSDLFETYVTIC